MDQYGDKIKNIVEEVLEVLAHFLQLDANYKSVYINAYHRKFHYENGYGVMRRFPEQSEMFLSIYKDPS